MEVSVRKNLILTILIISATILLTGCKKTSENGDEVITAQLKTPMVTPEPIASILFLLGGSAMGIIRHRRNKKKA